MTKLFHPKKKKDGTPRFPFQFYEKRPARCMCLTRGRGGKKIDGGFLAEIIRVYQGRKVGVEQKSAAVRLGGKRKVRT